MEWLSETPSAVDVRWPAYDAGGGEKFSARSHDTMRLGDDGHAPIRAGGDSNEVSIGKREGGDPLACVFTFLKVLAVAVSIFVGS